MGLGLRLSADSDTLLPQLRGEKRVEFIVAAVGRYDAVVTIRAANPGELHEQVERIRQIDGIEVAESWAHIRAAKQDYTRRL